MEGTYFNLIKAICVKLRANIMINQEKIKQSITIKTRNRSQLAGKSTAGRRLHHSPHPLDTVNYKTHPVTQTH